MEKPAKWKKMLKWKNDNLFSGMSLLPKIESRLSLFYQWGYLMTYPPFQNPEHPATGSYYRQAFRILRKPSSLMKTQASRLRYPQFPFKFYPWHSWQMAGLWEYGTRSQWAVSWESIVACEGPGIPPDQDQGLFSQGA